MNHGTLRPFGHLSLVPALHDAPPVDADCAGASRRPPPPPTTRIYRAINARGLSFSRRVPPCVQASDGRRGRSSLTPTLHHVLSRYIHTRTHTFVVLYIFPIDSMWFSWPCQFILLFYVICCLISFSYLPQCWNLCNGNYFFLYIFILSLALFSSSRSKSKYVRFFPKKKKKMCTRYFAFSPRVVFNADFMNSCLRSRNSI